ncbi:hypothetical protein BGX26_002034 [Mortierella sp. AD094]|nr:hypothetical protein BGX26_002034 [Mortierella sp. AD094]
MLKPTHLVHSRNHSYEHNTPPPYIQSPDDIYTEQDNTTERSMGKELDPPQDYDDDLLARVHQINDPDLLKQLLIQKEQERQGLASNLDLAARLGLDLHQQIQRLELESTLQIQSLQDENHALQSKASLSQDLQYQLSSSEHEVKELTGHNRFLQRELDACRQELKSFRKELDELSEHMTEISTEMFDAKSKVNSYARRLGEVEQELASTQELNVNLQIQLDNALQKQKQTHSSTTQAVKMIQSDLGKVFSDSDTMRMTLEDLETRQMKCEGKVMEMMTNTREYAQLLEEAQETIHTLRIESDMEGRGWSSRGPQAAIWDNKTGEHPEQHLREVGDSKTHHIRVVIGATVHESSNELVQAEELDPTFDTTGWGASGMNSLGMELGLGNLNEELAGASRSLDQELSGFGHQTSLDQELAEKQSEFQGSLASELGAAESRLHFNSTHEHTVSSFAMDELNDIAYDVDGDNDETSVLPQRFSLSAELHQRLEENNILQNVLSAKPSWGSTTTSIGISSVLGPAQHSSNSIRDIGRTLSMMTLANQKASTSTSTLTVMMSPKAPSQSPNLSSVNEMSASASMSPNGFAPSGPNLNSSGTDFANTSISATISSPGARRAAMDAQNILGLKYLLSATSSADLSNVITKTNAKPPTLTNPAVSSKDTKARFTAATGSGARATTGSTKDTKSPSTSIPKRTSSIPSDRMTPSKPIAIVGASDARSGRKPASPASSWSTSSSAIPIPSMSRRPSLPPISSSPSTPTGPSSGNKPRPPWN